MKLARLKNRLFFSLFFAGTVLVSSSAYADRTINFYGSADNDATYGLYKTAPAASTCKITLNNQSGQSQQYMITVSNISSTGLAAGPYTLVTPNPGGVGSYVSIANATTHNYTFKYQQLPISTVGTQHVWCAGKITIKDVTNPGSLGFAGNINTYTEEQITSGLTTTYSAAKGSAAMPGFVPLSTTQN